MNIKDFFQRNLVNRLNMPVKHVLVCEDVLLNQASIAKHFSELFEHEGSVEVSYVPSGLAAAGILEVTGIDLILLDHDMPNGSGSELLHFMHSKGLEIPVITFSGIDYNNERMKMIGAHFKYLKQDVIDGKADELIKTILQV